MSEFPNKWWKKTEFSSVVLSVFSLILSHPLYFCYLIFFSPYILKILSFLSPLFITTFLLLFALFTTTTLVNDNPNTPHQSSQLKLNFLLTTYHNIVQKLRSSNAGHDEEFLQFEEFEAYKIVFEASALELLEQEQQQQQQQESALEEPVDKYPSHESYVSDDDQPKITNTNDDVNYEIMHYSETTLEEPNDKGEEASRKSGSKAIESKISQVKEINGDHNGVVEYLSKVRSKSQRLGNEYTSTLGSFGSMRKEKEWKRTLACKLFEERHSVNVDGIGGAEGMDLLWETHEGNDSNKKLSKSKTNKVTGKRYEDEDEEEEEEEELDNGQLCCLQALKFSAGKMGRPNLVKFSKALKGFGWLHHVTKHGTKKVHP
ncbi:hypothetical protein Ddye_001327 [Dipteronia dyeriana]|uniref:Transmembrane protein n=1 Tax=Dipteronia dyeriana TaxID=168575 RepID=A0AAD9XPN7_9ROSI|nr:hypothetical protein Ddye_001327 [Dipteronia dyeriana]